MKKYIVEVSEIVARQYEVEAHTPEEAENIAESYRADGELGNVVDTEILGTEVVEEEEGEE
jgi:hypothetical protein